MYTSFIGMTEWRITTHRNLCRLQRADLPRVTQQNDESECNGNLVLVTDGTINMM